MSRKLWEGFPFKGFNGARLTRWHPSNRSFVRKLDCM